MLLYFLTYCVIHSFLIYQFNCTIHQNMSILRGFLVLRRLRHSRLIKTLRVGRWISHNLFLFWMKNSLVWVPERIPCVLDFCWFLVNLDCEHLSTIMLFLSYWWSMTMWADICLCCKFHRSANNIGFLDLRKWRLHRAHATQHGWVRFILISS